MVNRRYHERRIRRTPSPSCPSGTVLAAAEIAGSNLPGKIAEIYNPTKAAWSLTASLNTARAMHTATLLPNGKAW
jgi:hypothetical protein